MTEDAIKELLMSYPKLKAQKTVLEEIMVHSSDELNDGKHAIIFIQVRIIEAALDSLSDNERLIIKQRFIEGLTWKEIIEKIENNDIPCSAAFVKTSYSERTLKRIQKKALCKIIDFIGKSGFDEYME